MENFNNYKIEKDALLSKIQEIHKQLGNLSDIGIDCEEEIQKLNNVIKTIQQDIINVVLVGSISDGKTSLIAGWLGEEQSNMKIDSDESSDEILVYKSKSLPDYCKLVDTPGLFGSKEDEKNNCKLSDKTEKFLDQATLILYVVEAGNPVKDSHKEVLRWILKDLHKLDNTVFIINKMDEVSDLTDEKEFNNMAKIKVKTLKQKLSEIADLSQEELEKLHIICISTDPQKKGFKFWNKNRSEYEARSRINSLEIETNKMLKENTVTSLVTKTGYDVVSHVINEKIQTVEEQIEIIDELMPELEEALRRDEKDYEHAREQVLKIQPKLVKQFRETWKKTIRQLNNTTVENIGEFLEFDVGVKDGKIEGHLIEEKIYLIASEYFNKTSVCIDKLQKKLNYNNQKQDKLYEKMLNKGGKGAAKAIKAAGKLPINKMKDAVKAGRDIINKVFKTSIKFKPWQAVKIAKGLSKSLPIIGAGIDVVIEIAEAVKRDKDNKRFSKYKEDIKETINNVYETVIAMVRNEEKFLENFAPELKNLQAAIQTQQEAIDEQKKMKVLFSSWKKNAIDAEFKVQ